MPLQAADTSTLVAVVEDVLRPEAAILNLFFPTLQEFDTEYVDFDILLTGQKLAPFVRPDLPGKMQEAKGYTTQTYKPAYVKPKEPVNPNRALKRLPGERRGGELTPAARLDAAAVDALDMQRRQVIARKEWMALQALTTGKVVVSGEGYGPETVDFGRDAALTVTLTTTDRWGETGVDPLDSIESWADTIAAKSGVPGTTVILGPEAAKLLKKSTRFIAALDNRRQVDGSAELGPQAIDPRISRLRWVGELGDFVFWAYQQYYQLDDGTPAKMIDDHGVIMGSDFIEGVQCHGAIQDVQGLMPMEYFPKLWEEDDPSRLIAMTQSAPLVVPSRVNASFYAKVR